MGRHWEETLFGCASDVPSCLLTCLLPGGLCIIQATAVNNATHDGKSVPYILVYCLGCIGGAINRETIRKKLDIEGSLVSSCLTWCCCAECAACQEYREVKKHSHHQS
jgi:Cys-rich protein (TIGR01571 family)